MGGWERAARGTRECTCSSVADEVHERANYDAPRPPQRVHLGRAVSYMPTVSEHNERERVGDRARVRRARRAAHDADVADCAPPRPSEGWQRAPGSISLT